MLLEIVLAASDTATEFPDDEVVFALATKVPQHKNTTTNKTVNKFFFIFSSYYLVGRIEDV